MPPKTEPAFLIGLIGAGIQVSRPPALHEAEGAARGVRCIYKLIDLEVLGLGVEALPELVTAAERMGFAGLNITHPCKQAVLPLLHELSPDARALGAVNTVVLRNGRRIGHDTDWFGFAESFRRGLPDVARDRVVQLGACGAGSAVAHAALTVAVRHLTIFDIDPARAATVAAGLCARFGEGRAAAGADLAAAVAAADGVINATPMGMANYPGLPLPAALLCPALWVAEIVYLPLETRVAARCPCARLPHAGWRRHGGVPGGRGVPAVHRDRTGYGTDAPALRRDGRRRVA
jgi:shikimate dehydrogenase